MSQLNSSRSKDEVPTIILRGQTLQIPKGHSRRSKCILLRHRGRLQLHGHRHARAMSRGFIRLLKAQVLPQDSPHDRRPHDPETRKSA